LEDISDESTGDNGVSMRIGKIKRLRIAYAVWKALGAKNRNSMIAVVHECGLADVMSGQLPDDVVEDMQRDAENDSARGYDHG